jgi:hypothetical protein
MQRIMEEFAREEERRNQLAKTGGTLRRNRPTRDPRWPSVVARHPSLRDALTDEDKEVSSGISILSWSCVLCLSDDASWLCRPSPSSLC